MGGFPIFLILKHSVNAALAQTVWASFDVEEPDSEL